MLVHALKNFELTLKSLQCLFVRLHQVINFDDPVTSFLDPCAHFGFKTVLDQSATYVRIRFESMESLRVH